MPTPITLFRRGMIVVLVLYGSWALLKSAPSEEVAPSPTVESIHFDQVLDMTQKPEPDIVEPIQQTVKFKELWATFSKSPSAKGIVKSMSRKKHLALQDDINKIQNNYFPWLANITSKPPGFRSIFDLVKSHEREAGIVLVTGKEDFRWMMHLVGTLRNVLNCSLPIEIFYCGDNDLPVKYRRVIEDFSLRSSTGGDIRTIDLTTIFPDPDGIIDLPGRWAARPFAILASSFKRVILTDADAIFLQDPSLLLQEPGFIKTGALFYRDRILEAAEGDVYDWVEDILEKVNATRLDEVKKDSAWFSRQTKYEMDSGAVLIDKTKNLAALLLVCHFNLKEIRENLTYKKFWGDKESYWLAHALTSTPYHFVQGYCGGIGHISRKYQKHRVEEDAMTEEELEPYLESLKISPEVICTLQLLHVLESTGEPLWINNGLTEYKWANDDRFIEAEGWVGHDGHWGEGPARFPMERCIESTLNQGDSRMAGYIQNNAVNRPSSEMKKLFKEIIKEAKRWDEICQNHGLFEVAKGVSMPIVEH